MFTNCSGFGDVLEVRSSVFAQNHMFGHVGSSFVLLLKKLCSFFINKVRKQFGFWWCSRGSKFGFGPKVWYFDVCSASIQYQSCNSMALMLITTLASVTRYTLLWSFRKLGQVDNRIYYMYWVCGCSVAKKLKQLGVGQCHALLV